MKFQNCKNIAFEKLGTRTFHFPNYRSPSTNIIFLMGVPLISCMFYKLLVMNAGSKGTGSVDFLGNFRSHPKSILPGDAPRHQGLETLVHGVARLPTMVEDVRGNLL